MNHDSFVTIPEETKRLYLFCERIGGLDHLAVMAGRPVDFLIF